MLKGKVPKLHKCNDCSVKYYGQANWSNRTQVKDHLAHIRCSMTDKWCVFYYMMENNHPTHMIFLKLLTQVNK